MIMRKWSWLGIIVLIVTLVITTLLRIEQTALLIFLAVIVAIIPFLISYEQKKIKARDLMPIIVLSAMAVAGRMLMAPFPNFKPVTAIVIIAGMAFGAESGFMTGALSALVSNFFFGQGPWTPWQMLAWGLIGYIAGVLTSKNLLNKTWTIILYGIVSSLCFGLIMDTWTVLGFIQPGSFEQAIATYALGMAFNVSHIISTVAFLIPIHKPWLRQLKRIKLKFDLT